MVQDNIFGVEFLAQAISVNGGFGLQQRKPLPYTGAQNPYVPLFLTSRGENVNLDKVYT